MARGFTKTKSGQGKTYGCSKCGKPIEKGQRYHEWTLYRAPTRRRHEACGRPQQSELTSSKMSQAYAAVEALQEAVAAARKANDPTGLADALRECASEVESCRDEYQDGFDSMNEGLQQGQQGQDIEEKIGPLDEFKDSLEKAADE